MGERTIPTGLGRLYVCRTTDAEKNLLTDLQPLGELLNIKPGMLTYKDGDDDGSAYETKGFRTTSGRIKVEPSEEMMELLMQPRKWDVELQHKLGRMPRKMKKAHRKGSKYCRDTKWKRKVKAYARRFNYRLPNAEIVVTQEQRNRLSVTISAINVNKKED